MENKRLRFLHDTRKLALPLVISLALAYILKIIFILWWNDTRGTSGTIWWIICPLACLIGVGVVAFTFWLTVIFIERNQYAAPMFLSWCGLIIVLIAPLPPLPKPVFPEETFFAAHRAEFEAVVALAREDQLKCLPTVGCDMMVRSLPPEYSDLSVDKYIDDKYIEAAHDPESGLTVIFWPIVHDYSLIYFDNPDGRNSLTSSDCPLESRLTRVLDAHWYVCGDGAD